MQRHGVPPTYPETSAQMEEHELDLLASKSRRTRRPDYEALADMLRAAAELPCAPDEEAALKDLLAAFETWEVGHCPPSWLASDSRAVARLILFSALSQSTGKL